MAIAIAGSIGTMGDITTTTGTYTVSGGANRVLVIGAGAHQTSVGTVSFNGTEITRTVIGTSTLNENLGIWVYVNPPASADGTIVAKGLVGAGIGFIAAELTGVSQTGQPAGSANADNGNSSTPSGTLTTSVNGDWIIGGYYSEGAYSSDNAGQTAIMQKQAQAFENMGLSYINKSTAGAGTLGWTLSSGQRWGVSLVNLNAVATGLTGVTPGKRSLLGVGN